jgi:uncharacterized protein YidB (DUF937 family)
VATLSFATGLERNQETIMGLLDILNGMQNGPRGPSEPSAQSESGGMSPMTLAILALLGYKALKHFTGSHPEASPSAPAPAPGRTINAGPPGGTINAGLPGSGGGLGDLLKGGLGGLLAGGAAGSILSGGLGDLLNQLQNKGHGETANSWVSPGPNKQIAPRDLADALGADQINALTAQTGLSREELLAGLSQHLPNVVNHLTPDGRLPTESELSRML